MIAFARLLERLVFTPQRLVKLALLKEYFSNTPDPDRGWALAALAGTLNLPNFTSSTFRTLTEERVDPVLFRLSYDFVGDLAETVALIWPDRDTDAHSPRLSEVVDILRATKRPDRPEVITRLFNQMNPSERFAFIKLCTGNMRIGVSARLAKTALAEWGQQPVEQIEELWSGLEPPYVDLFRWLEGKTGMPDIDLSLAFRPMMLAHPLDNALYSATEQREKRPTESESLERLQARLTPQDFAAEWKWDGIRVQAMHFNGEKRLYSRTGDDISHSFPDALEALAQEGCVDGELLVVRKGEVAPFADLQKRLGRKVVSAKMLASHPAHIRIYDFLHDGTNDIRALSLRERRACLETWFVPAPRLDLSEIISFSRWDTLAEIRAGAREASQEGLMLKRWDAPYTGGRPTGIWFKWKRNPLSADCVLMYAQRGHGKRSSFYSDFTFGAWHQNNEGKMELVPVGKAYSGYSDDELVKIDKFIRDNTIDRFGPVRSVKPELVFEVAFDDVQESTRHKSGIAMRFPRIKRIRWDKPAHEADTLETLEQILLR